MRPIEAVVPGAQGRVLAVLAETTADLDLRTGEQNRGSEVLEVLEVGVDEAAASAVGSCPDGRCPSCSPAVAVGTVLGLVFDLGDVPEGLVVLSLVANRLLHHRRATTV